MTHKFKKFSCYILERKEKLEREEKCECECNSCSQEKQNCDNCSCDHCTCKNCKCKK